MESITTDEQDLTSALPEPHFDEEATVLSARPVVPLEEIKTRENSKKWLVLGAVTLLSLLIGALGGSLIYRQRAQKSTIVETPEVEGTLKAFNEAKVPVEKPVTEVSSKGVPDTTPNIITKAEPTDVIPKSSPRVQPHVAAPARTKERVTMANTDNERELRRAQRIEEHRQNRRAEWQEMREARRQRRSSDDLLRIRDIFEGPRHRN